MRYFVWEAVERSKLLADLGLNDAVVRSSVSERADDLLWIIRGEVPGPLSLSYASGFEEGWARLSFKLVGVRQNFRRHSVQLITRAAVAKSSCNLEV
jgi:hypothetical protein